MEHAHEHEEHELISYGTYVGIWLALLVLTALTVAVAGLDLGKYNVLVAMLVAVTKTTLVLLYFMHLRYESKLFFFMILLIIVIMVIITAFTFVDDYRFNYVSF